MLIGFTQEVSPAIGECQVTFIDRAAIDYQQARHQHNAYCATLERCGVQLNRLQSSLAYPDGCFVEDTAIIVDELAIITNPGAASRRGEIDLMETELARYRGVARIAPPANIDGGDVLQVGRKIFVGLSSRTNRQGVEALKHLLQPYGYQVIPISIKASLHLKTACTAIDDETLLINPAWIDREQLKGFAIVCIPTHEPWAANTIRTNGTLCLQTGFPATAELVGKHHSRI